MIDFILLAFVSWVRVKLSYAVQGETMFNQFGEIMLGKNSTLSIDAGYLHNNVGLKLLEGAVS